MKRCLLIVLMLVASSPFVAKTTTEPTENKLKMLDVFEMEFVSDPQISPDGKTIVYVRNFMDIMEDKKRGNLWIIKSDGKDNMSLTTGMVNDYSSHNTGLKNTAQKDEFFLSGSRYFLTSVMTHLP